jgi:AmpD protein
MAAGTADCPGPQSAGSVCGAQGERLSQPTYSVDPATSLLRGARQVFSMHCDERPAGAAPELIILHGISLPPGQFGGGCIEQLFCGALAPHAHPYFAGIARSRVSAHLLLARDGRVTQFVPFGARAWHAGLSAYRGRAACNDFSVGIELEGTDEIPYDDRQYLALDTVLRALLRDIPTLSVDHIVGHSDVAPGRKTDPGLSFDWQRLRAGLSAPAGRDGAQ